LVGFADFVDFAGFDALADRAGLEVRATFASCALGVVRALFVSIAIVVARAALATLTDRAARAALEALAFATFAIVTWVRFTNLADFVATLAAAFVARNFFATLDGAFTDFVDFFADFLADLLADFEGPAGLVDFAAAPRAAIAPRFAPLVTLRFFGTAAIDSLPPTAAPSNKPCGNPQPISNCSAMRR
jgi:hypothetical protein